MEDYLYNLKERVSISKKVINMWYEDIFNKVKALADEEQSVKMSTYMQNKFILLGVPKPKLSEAIKPYMKNVTKE